MGGYSDSSDDDRRQKKKKKRRSISRSREASIDSSVSSRKSAKHKSKKKKRQRSRSRTPEVKYRRRRSRSISRDRGYRRSRSRSGSRQKYSRRSQSRSRDRRSYSRDRLRRSWSKDRRSRSRDRRSRSRDRRSGSRGYSRRRSYSRDRHSRSHSPSRRRRRQSRSCSQDSRLEALRKEKDDPCSQVPGFADMAPADQAKIRMQLALKAAAAADEKLKEQGVLLHIQPKTAMTAGEQKKFNQAVDSIETESFAPAAFFSSRDKPAVKEEDEFGRSNLEKNHDSAIFGSGKLDIKLDPSERTNVVYNGATSLAHPNLHKTTQEKMGRWIEKLTAMRKRKLEGDLLT